MPFPGEERYREALAKAEGHESISAMVKVTDLKAALAEIERLKTLLWTPEVEDFVKSAVQEAGHQRDRWGDDHDARKSAEDWLWNVAYLSTKAIQALRYGDRFKYLHHIVTTAALCANWHRHALQQMGGEIPQPLPVGAADQPV